ncbi:MAG: hypothetical protein ACYC6M_03110 [Terriglobales bacterium]
MKRLALVAVLFASSLALAVGYPPAANTIVDPDGTVHYVGNLTVTLDGGITATIGNVNLICDGGSGCSVAVKYSVPLDLNSDGGAGVPVDVKASVPLDLKADGGSGLAVNVAASTPLDLKADGGAGVAVDVKHSALPDNAATSLGDGGTYLDPLITDLSSAAPVVTSVCWRSDGGGGPVALPKTAGRLGFCAENRDTSQSTDIGPITVLVDQGVGLGAAPSATQPGQSFCVAASAAVAYYLIARTTQEQLDAGGTGCVSVVEQ